MFKLQFASGLSLVAGVITLVISLLSDARPVTVLYRTIISVSIFSVLGYLATGIIQNLILAKLEEKRSQTSGKVDIVSEQEDVSLNKDSQFDPFTPDKFEHITSPKD
ncbi:hypothetical protein [Dendrosporobacter sp. 1207_IL3150]|uniref:hypothetical protein n=1 Tax=Dendrosporobacter sp. 1207_IL3150 TaxID=3084054 RepID=UPI002FDB4DD5